MKKNAFTLMVATLLLAACGGDTSPKKVDDTKSGAGVTESAKPVESTKSVEPAKTQEAISVTADELEKAYAENEVAANEKYKDKTLKVTGKIYSIESGIGDVPYVVFQSKDQFSLNQVQAKFADSNKSKIATLKKKASLTVVCKSAGEVAGSPMLEDCEIQ
jgi:ABC-type glycerol-3-phosphate transport system substrate-binding protein